MKNHFIFYFLLILIFTFSSCSKEEALPLSAEERIQQALQTLETQQEIDFFDLDFVTRKHPQLLPSVRTRDDRSDWIDSVYQHILFEHQELSIVPAMIQQFGYPVWNESDLLEDEEGLGIPAVLIPFIRLDQNHISAYLLSVPTGSGDWHFIMVDRPTLDLLLADPDSGSHPDLRFHITAYTRFDVLLFGTKNQIYTDWLVEKGDLEIGGEWEIANPRGLITTYTYCAKEETLVFTEGDTRGCEIWVTIRINTCAGNGEPNPNFGSGPIGGVIDPGGIPHNNSGNGGSTPNDDPLSDPTNLMNLCSQFDAATGFEGTPQDLEALNQLGVSLDYLASNCGAIQVIFNSDLFSNANIVAMIQADNGGLLPQIANRVINNADPAMINKYIALIDQTDLAFKGFEMLWMFIEENLVDVLDGEEINFLLVNGKTIGNKLKTAYFAYSQTQRNWLNDHLLHKEQVVKNLTNNVDDVDGQEFITDHVNLLILEDDYKEFVESTVGWSSAMWAIAKELIGDKAVDLAFELIPGFNKADEVKDAFKAAKNGDWLEFFVESSKIILEETPWGKWIKALDITQELVNYYKKVEKIWDKIGDLGEEAIERLWGIAKKSPLKINPSYLKYVADLETPTLGFAPGAPVLEQGVNASQFYRWQVFKANFPEVTDVQMTNMEIHHAFPQSLGWRFPNFGFNGEQIHSLENLRGIPKTTMNPNNPSQKLHVFITLEWESFFSPFLSTGTSPTMQQLTDFAKGIDDEFGTLFNPPIR